MPVTSPEGSDTQSLSQLKQNFQERMNEAIRQQRERMRVLLNDVDSVGPRALSCLLVLLLAAC